MSGALGRVLGLEWGLEWVCGAWVEREELGRGDDAVVMLREEDECARTAGGGLLLAAWGVEAQLPCVDGWFSCCSRSSTESVSETNRCRNIPLY